MFLPSRRDFDLFDDIFKDPFFNNESKIMKTDIRENDNNYIIDIDLPGYEKENIEIEIDNGYLNVSAKESVNNNSNDGKYLKKERYYGECKRSFYIGEDVEVEDIKANFKNGILKLEVPKEKEKEIKNKKYIQIED